MPNCTTKSADSPPKGQGAQLVEKNKTFVRGAHTKGRHEYYSLKEYRFLLWDILVCHNPNAFTEITHTQQNQPFYNQWTELSELVKLANQGHSNVKAVVWHLWNKACSLDYRELDEKIGKSIWYLYEKYLVGASIRLA